MQLPNIQNCVLRGMDEEGLGAVWRRGWGCFGGGAVVGEGTERRGSGLTGRGGPQPGCQGDHEAVSWSGL